MLEGGGESTAMAKIEWTEKTWNPIRGCSRVSDGCVNCYAEEIAARFSGPGKPYEGLAKRINHDARWTGKVRFIEERLDAPLHWKKPSRIFVNSMSDLFHEKVKDEWIDSIFAVMATACQHTFQVLTKRPARMADYAQALADGRRSLPPVWDAREQRERHWAGLPPNVWLGVSVEDQATADERIPLLLETPAAVRWVSYEPALGPVDFSSWLGGGLDWIVVGGESGPGARRFDLAWARQTIAQCRAAGVSVFVKQMGSRPIVRRHPVPRDGWEPVTGQNGQPIRLTNTKGGDMAEWPTALRVREYPGAAARAEPRVRLIRTPAH
jgi:protein gp37